MCQGWLVELILQTDFKGSPGHRISLGDGRVVLNPKGLKNGHMRVSDTPTGCEFLKRLGQQKKITSGFSKFGKLDDEQTRGPDCQKVTSGVIGVDILNQSQYF